MKLRSYKGWIVFLLFYLVTEIVKADAMACPGCCNFPAAVGSVFGQIGKRTSRNVRAVVQSCGGKHSFFTFYNDTNKLWRNENPENVFMDIGDTLVKIQNGVWYKIHRGGVIKLYAQKEGKPDRTRWCRILATKDTFGIELEYASHLLKATHNGYKTNYKKLNFKLTKIKYTGPEIKEETTGNKHAIWFLLISGSGLSVLVSVFIRKKQKV